MREAETDVDLVRRYLEGDVQAFGTLVERHERRVYNLALRMTGREEDARDATQEAFVSALRKLKTFRGEAAFTTWMHRVTVNACYDLLRKRQRAPLLRERDEDTPPPREPVSPDHADDVDLSIDVRAALLDVPMDFRAVLILCDVQDLSYEDAAEALGVPVGTVKSRLHRGRVALARALGPPGDRERSDTGGPSDGTVM
ncbi:MAG TPA: sigma-70 family RNA polymerase sigma factor [Actinomycetota bacterium]|nr:sigma-70 family RNA polymerase sigma factor [Actinomycetota bacterium]